MQTETTALNKSIAIEVKTRFLEEQSEPQAARYVFGYTITLTNNGPGDVQLISRHWIITDDNGEVQEVQGTGVVGEQPVISPGANYSYSSGVILATETGTMTGTYQMRATDGEQFDAPIPAFALVPPHRLH